MVERLVYGRHTADARQPDQLVAARDHVPGGRRAVHRPSLYEVGDPEDARTTVRSDDRADWTDAHRSEVEVLAK